MSSYLGAVQVLARAPIDLIDAIAGKVDRALGYKSSAPSYLGRTVAVVTLGAATVGVYYAARRVLEDIKFVSMSYTCTVENLNPFDIQLGDGRVLKAFDPKDPTGTFQERSTALTGTTIYAASRWVESAKLTNVRLVCGYKV